MSHSRVTSFEAALSDMSLDADGTTPDSICYLTLSRLRVTSKHHNKCSPPLTGLQRRVCDVTVWFKQHVAAVHEQKHVAEQHRNTSVASRLLVMSEAYQEEDAALQLALHLCCCSDAESPGSLVRNNRQPLHLVEWRLIPSDKLAERHFSHCRGSSARCQSRTTPPLSLLLSRRACPGELSPNKPSSLPPSLPPSRLHRRARVKNGAFTSHEWLPASFLFFFSKQRQVAYFHAPIFPRARM